MSKILVPVDFSDCSYELVRRAIDTVRAEGGELRILYVLEPPARDPEAEIQVRGGPRRAVKEHLRSEAEAQLKAYEADLRDISYELVLVEGEPISAILKAASDREISKVMMMTRGRRGAMRLLYGSITEAVRKKLTKPLEVIQTVHKSSCEAGACSTCVSGVGEARFQSLAEEDG